MNCSVIYRDSNVIQPGSNMKTKQIQILNETGLGLLAKANLCTVAKDAQTFTDLGLKLLAEARSILDSNRRNSVVIFVEFCAYLGKCHQQYSAYAEYCGRNGLEIVSEHDFEALCEHLIIPDALAAARRPPPESEKPSS